MAEMLPELLSAFDEKKTRAMKAIAGALADPTGVMGQLMAQKQDAVNTRNDATKDAVAQGDWPGVTNLANQGIAPAPSYARALPEMSAENLLPHQLPVYQRLLAALGDPKTALEQTLKMTNLMTPR